MHWLIIFEHAQCKCKDQISLQVKAAVHLRWTKQFMGHSSHAAVFNCRFDVGHVLLKVTSGLTVTHSILECNER